MGMAVQFASKLDHWYGSFTTVIFATLVERKELAGDYLALTKYELDSNHRIWQVVAAIPSGKVATYGEIAQKAGMCGAARRVGMALRELPANTRIPWHRVVNASGRIALPRQSTSHVIQRDRLEGEKIEFKTNGSIDLNRFGW